MKIIIEIEDVNKMVEIELPFPPSIGDQIYITDFISEADEIEYNKIPGVDLDGLKVVHKTWLRDEFRSTYLQVLVK